MKNLAILSLTVFQESVRYKSLGYAVNNSPLPHPGLRFGSDGAMFWKGRPLEHADMPNVLAAFRDLVALHLMAWWENWHSPLLTGILPQSGILVEMAGLAPLYKTLDYFRSNLETEGYFSDRMEVAPERPKPLPKPKKIFRFPANTLAGELERRNAAPHLTQAWAAYETGNMRSAYIWKMRNHFPDVLRKPADTRSGSGN